MLELELEAFDVRLQGQSKAEATFKNNLDGSVVATAAVTFVTLPSEPRIEETAVSAAAVAEEEEVPVATQYFPPPNTSPSTNTTLSQSLK